jgi:hypothetical protein
MKAIANRNFQDLRAVEANLNSLWEETAASLLVKDMILKATRSSNLSRRILHEVTIQTFGKCSIHLVVRRLVDNLLLPYRKIPNLPLISEAVIIARMVTLVRCVKVIVT